MPDAASQPINSPTFLSFSDFDFACAKLEDAHRNQGLSLDPHLTIARIGKGEDQRLQITRTVYIDHTESTDQQSMGNEDDEIEDEIPEDSDDEAFHHSARNSLEAWIVYTIVLSPTYGVPVLYFHVSNDSKHGPTGIEFVYQYLVPNTTASQLQGIGIMGGISMTNHPVTDRPCFFVHPCNTASAMQEIIGSRVISTLEYLQLWIGLIGASVGLSLPKELAAKIIEMERK